MSETVNIMTVTLALSGLPESPPCCPVEGPVTEWLLTVHGGLLQVACPRCFTAIAPVRAVASPAKDPYPGLGKVPSYWHRDDSSRENSQSHVPHP